MSKDIGANFLNALLGGLTQSVKNAQTEDDVVVEANFKFRLADPKRVAPVVRSLQKEEEHDGQQPATESFTAGTRIPEVAVERPRTAAVPTTAPAPAAGPRVEMATRQQQPYAPRAEESPELVPRAITAPVDYNPEYQEQFDRYLRTRQFDHMYGPALRGYGAPIQMQPV